MSLLSLAQSIAGRSVPVLCYHQVRPGSGMSPEKFGRQLDRLAAFGFQTISLARLHRVITGREGLESPALVITFDDCTLDNWVYAVPELLRRGMCAAFFAITDFLVPGAARPRADQGGRPEIPALDEIMRQSLRGHCEGFMNHGEIRALVREAGMEVYAHSAAHQACFVSNSQAGFLGEGRHWSHEALCGPGSPAGTPVHPVGSAYAHPGFGLDWRGQPLSLGTREERLAFCLEDFAGCKARLEDILGQPCPFLCLPWGEYDEVTLEAARAAGFEGVLNLQAGFVGPGSDPMRIGRLAVKDRKGPAWLGFKSRMLAIEPLAPLVRGRRPGGRA